MGIFNKQPIININMNGKEYVDYLKYKKPKSVFIKNLTKNQKEALMIFGVCFVLMFFAMILVYDLFYIPPPPTQGVINAWIKITPTISKLSWEQIGKFLLVLFAPIIVLSWLIHGVGFFIVQG